MTRPNELPIPDVAEQDPNSFELLRVWVANKNQQVSLRTGTWQDPAAWGILISDLIHHIANSYQIDRGLDCTKTIARIIEGLQVEMSHPTDQPMGKVVWNSENQE